ncbi:aspartate aminotransferase family protein [Streptacidiphilus pinicola]|uniref:Aspartate aminotransferase family protein n=1 Tax=Streptacidiphilus pinicola TaxID=2219663 RepID=A0A2X0ISV0_9ACTN|nr:aspartate aminotransferase family protein [Streptacidiphilus pinicola]RAG86341.1 aspartate aminotransferase family protein [Streptacidiphilus pinicola]
MSSTHELLEAAEHGGLGNYRPAPLVALTGSGRHLRDTDGRSYLDLTAGNAVTAVGHAHPRVTAAIAEQAGRVLHTSNLFHNEPSIRFTQELIARTAFDRVYLCNSGAEANETLIKLARRHHFRHGATERVRIVATTGGFHGRTMGALTLTGRDLYKTGMGPLLGGVDHVPYNDLRAMEEAVTETTAAVIVETIQAEAGVIPAREDYLRGLREICERTGALLFFDEVQTGYGRTGAFLSHEHSGVVPDACSLAKGIAAGFPMGAVAVREHLAGALPPGTHASTFGGNPVACAAALAVLDVFEDEDLLANATSRGEALATALAAMVADPALPATASRGKGLLQGLVLADDVDVAALLTGLREQGVLLARVGHQVLRFSPALNITAEELDEGLAVVTRVLAEAPRAAA